jgi:hypothetical protein
VSALLTRSLVAALVVVGAGSGLAAPAGAADPPPAKTFTVTATPATAVWSQAVRLTATITPRGGGAPQGGTVTFLADGEPVGTATATTRGTSLTTRALPVGTHEITASYAGDAVVAAGSAAGPAVVTVAPAPTTTTVTVADEGADEGDRVEVRAVVRASAPASPARRPTGTIAFTVDGCDDTGTVALNANGVATWRPRLCGGAHAVVATYSGSATHVAGTAPDAPFVVGDPEIDQSNIDLPGDGDQPRTIFVGSGGGNPTAIAQQTIAGRTGTLHAVDVQVGWVDEGGAAPGDLLVTIQTTDGSGDPTGTILGSGSISASDIGEGTPSQEIRIALDTPASVTDGMAIALVLTVDPSAPATDDAWAVTALLPSSHTRGALVAQFGSGTGWLDAAEPGDLVFRTLVTAT